MGGILDKLIDIGVDVRYRYDPYTSIKKSTTFAPQYSQTITSTPSLQYDYTFNPQYIFGSPEASISSKKEGSTQAPSIFVIPSQTVSPSQIDAPFMPTTEAPLRTEGGGMFGDLIGIAAIGIIGVVVIMYVTKRKKGRDVKVSAVPGK